VPPGDRGRTDGGTRSGTGATGHTPAAAVGLVALALWPAASAVPGRRSARVATIVLLALLGWLAIELRHGDLLGLSERVLAAAKALWPLAVAVTLIRRHHQPTLTSRTEVDRR
jgi:Protein of unknown function (DUF998)